MHAEAPSEPMADARTVTFASEVTTHSIAPEAATRSIDTTSTDPVPVVLVAPKKPRRQLGMAQNQAGAPVVVETVKPMEL